MKPTGNRHGTALERLYYWREQHRLRAKWLRASPGAEELRAYVESGALDPEFHETVAIPDYDLWIAALEAAEAAMSEDPARWNFDTLVFVAQTLLDRHWPADVFDGSSGDPGPVFVARLRDALSARPAPPQEGEE